jgi:hypothetical protein
VCGSYPLTRLCKRVHYGRCLRTRALLCCCYLSPPNPFPLPPAGAADAEVEEVDVQVLEPLGLDLGWAPELSDELLGGFEVLLQPAHHTHGASGAGAASRGATPQDKQAVAAVDVLVAVRTQLQSRAVQALASMCQHPATVKVR